MTKDYYSGVISQVTFRESFVVMTIPMTHKHADNNMNS